MGELGSLLVVPLPCFVQCPARRTAAPSGRRERNDARILVRSEASLGGRPTKKTRGKSCFFSSEEDEGKKTWDDGTAASPLHPHSWCTNLRARVAPQNCFARNRRNDGLSPPPSPLPPSGEFQQPRTKKKNRHGSQRVSAADPTRSLQSWVVLCGRVDRLSLVAFAALVYR